MSKFYIESPEQVYGCFRCGKMMGEVKEDMHGYTCGECGERSVVTFTNTLDILNDLYLKGDISYVHDGIEIDLEDFDED